MTSTRKDIETRPTEDGSNDQERELDTGIDVDGREAAFESPEEYRQAAETEEQSWESRLEKSAEGGGGGSNHDAENSPDHKRNHEKPTAPSGDKGKVKDPNEIGWDGPDDPANPHNWRMSRKWTAMTIVSFFTLMSPLASSMVAPALPIISDEFGIKQGSVESSLILSIFVLAYAFGPLILGPLSEIFGRTKVLQVSNLLFLGFNIACGRAKTSGQMMVFRFLAGLGGSAPLAIGGGTISDLFSADNRGKALAVYTLAPLTGPALGPVIGAWIVQFVSWRWVFYATSIADCVIQVLGLIFLRETYAPVLIAHKTRQLRKSENNPKLRSIFVKPGHIDVHDGGPRVWAKVIGHGLMRPLKMLLFQPILQVLATYQAILYGTMYLTLTTFSALWVEKYHYGLGISGLHYIALGLGFTAGSQVGARLLDHIYKRLKARNGGVGTPEMRMPLMIITAFTLPVGLIIYGWSAQHHVVWIVPDIGAFFLAAGIMGSFLPIQSYLVDTYTLYAASAIGAASSFRSLAGFGFPLFANAMFNKLGLGWGNTLLALVAMSIGIPAPILFYKYGARLRAWSLKRHNIT
ncbi:hypothetical protein FRB94_007415 [Tulasnella sp. JGI-2019a]|nr:hypothetical protein FRB94_007415 [Tulasnella sp. JGI-2019a]